MRSLISSRIQISLRRWRFAAAPRSTNFTSVLPDTLRISTSSRSERSRLARQLNALREVLDPWLGKPQWKQNDGRVTFYYRFDSEDNPPIRLRLKVETNTREHFALLGYTKIPFQVSSRWFSGSAKITTFEIDELLATKLRALYQRRKGRDLFDLATALENPAVKPDRLLEAFSGYMEKGEGRITRAMFERNLAAKLRMPEFAADIGPLLAPGYKWNMENAARSVSERLIARLLGIRGRGNRNRRADLKENFRLG